MVDRRLRSFRQYLEERIGNEKGAYTLAYSGFSRSSKIYERAIALCEELEEYETSIESLNLKTRSYNCLKSRDITTIEQLVDQTERDLLRIRNFSRTSLRDVKTKLAERKLSLRRK